MQSADNVAPDQHASVQSNLGIFRLSTYTTVSTDSVSVQQRPRSVCTYVHADQSLHCPQNYIRAIFVCCSSYISLGPKGF